MSSFRDTYESIVLDPDAILNDQAQHHLLVFLITGNPGLCAYYEPYLTLLQAHCADELQHLSTDNVGPGDQLATHMYSVSLAGFESSRPPHASFTRKHGLGPYDLDLQVEYVDDAIGNAVAEIKARATDTTRSDVRVVIVGHSVGSYIMLEIIRRRQARARASGVRVVDGGVIGGIGVTPTVVDIAKSPTGRKVNTLASSPLLATVLSAFAKALSSTLPTNALTSLVQWFTGFPRDAAVVTARFIASPGAVYQSLYLARHELAQMKADKWDDELWGVSGASLQAIKTKLFFLFAETDYWIANETRDALIAARAGSGSGEGASDKPEMEIDHEGLVHAFCIQHNKLVADRTFAYLKRIVRTNWQLE